MVVTVLVLGAVTEVVLDAMSMIKAVVSVRNPVVTVVEDNV